MMTNDNLFHILSFYFIYIFFKYKFPAHLKKEAETYATLLLRVSTVLPVRIRSSLHRILVRFITRLCIDEPNGTSRKTSIPLIIKVAVCTAAPKILTKSLLNYILPS